ncbi:MAG: GNAT family N-acetyltransferase [Propionibacteriaceae bacterium]|nr:GNAT family N-acetyltransferase [Propionibacteriaceae bacterium]
MRARILTRADLEQVKRILSVDPVVNIFVSSRVEGGILDSHTSGTLYGWPADDVRSLLHVGQNLVPVAVERAAIQAFAEVLGRKRSAKAILGQANMALSLWAALARLWGRSYAVTREIRPRQPMMLMTKPPLWPADPRVRPITFREFDSYLEAFLAMYRDEIGDGQEQVSAHSFRQHCHTLVANNRAFGIVENGRVIFKADVGVSANSVAQIQGVWMAPEYRGLGMAAGAMSAITEYVLADYRAACLYVSSFNTAALRSYERVGFTTIDEFATVLF